MSALEFTYFNKMYNNHKNDFHILVHAIFSLKVNYLLRLKKKKKWHSYIY